MMNAANIHELTDAAIELLKQLIRQPSFSRGESGTAELLNAFLNAHGVRTNRHNNNVWAFNRSYDPTRPTVLLNSHHDTVKPNPGYTRDPFSAIEEDGKLYGLGSNDAGGSLVALIATFLHFYEREDLRFNLCLAATAEEEISGRNGVESILPALGPIEFALVGEPTQMQLAVAEKGLMVLDCVALGQAGHAAREEGINAIYRAMEDIRWFREYRFPRVSEWTGSVKMSVTVIEAGSQHNVVPSECRFVVDARVNECYQLEEVLESIRQQVGCTVTPRSVRLRPSSISLDHPLVKSGLRLGLHPFGSPTMSDQALLTCPSLKIGPGDSARSHTADEFILIEEIQEGVRLYCDLLAEVL